MALSKLTTVLNTISTMDTTIRDQASTVKADLEHDVNVVKDFINNTLTSEIDTLNDGNVKLAGEQLIEGVKTFGQGLCVPEPTEDMQPTTKKYVDDKADVHKESADHDSRYFTETELGSIVDNDSGANKIGVAPVPTLAGENAQAVLESIKGRLDNIGETNTNVELSNSHYGANGQTYASVGARCDSIDAKLVEVSGTLDQKANQESLDTTNTNVENLDLNKVDKNGSGQVTYAMLSQDVREQFTGGNTAVVDVDAVLEVNITDNAVTPRKTSYMERSRNIFSAYWSLGNLNSTTGAEETSTNNARTEYNDALPSTQYTVSLTKPAAGFNLYLFEYKTDGTFIQRTSLGSDIKYTFTTNSLTGKVRFTTYRASAAGLDLIPLTIQVELGSSATEYIHPIVLGKDYLNDDVVNLKKISTDIVNKTLIFTTDMFESGTYDSLTGIIKNDSTSVRTINYIYVHKGTVFTSSIYIQVFEYDLKSKSFLVCGALGASYTVQNDCYVRISSHTTSVSSAISALKVSNYYIIKSSIIDKQDILDEATDYIEQQSRNIFTSEWVIGALDTNGVEVAGTDNARTGFIPVQLSTGYIVQWERPNTLNKMYLYEYTSGKVFIKRTVLDYVDEIAFITTETTAYVRFMVYRSGAAGSDLIPSKCQLELGKIKTDYIPPKIIQKALTPLTISKDAVPTYYINHLDDKIATIKSLIKNCASNGDMFVFITDMHWAYNAKNSPQLIRYLGDNLNIPRLFMGGDNYDGLYPDVINSVKKSFNGNVYSMIGNHDYFNYASESEVFYDYSMMQKECVYGDNSRKYYYVDNAPQKIRYIVLNAWATNTSSPTSANVGFETAQVTWFTGTALNVDTGWTIIILAHNFYGIDAATDAVSVLNAGNIISAIDNYSGNGKIACMIQGHTHRDRIVYTPTKNVPCVICTCDKYKVYIEGAYSDLNVTRTLGTTSEQAFDVVVLDKSNKKLSFVRIGADALNGVGNAPGTAVGIREVTYS